MTWSFRALTLDTKIFQSKNDLVMFFFVFLCVFETGPHFTKQTFLYETCFNTLKLHNRISLDGLCCVPCNPSKWEADI